MQIHQTVMFAVLPVSVSVVLEARSKNTLTQLIHDHFDFLGYNRAKVTDIVDQEGSRFYQYRDGVTTYYSNQRVVDNDRGITVATTEDDTDVSYILLDELLDRLYDEGVYHSHLVTPGVYTDVLTNFLNVSQGCKVKVDYSTKANHLRFEHTIYKD